MTLHRRTAQLIAAAALAPAGVLAAAVVSAAGATTTPAPVESQGCVEERSDHHDGTPMPMSPHGEDGHAGMARMHQQMMNGHPGMAQMHQRMSGMPPAGGDPST